MSEQVETLVQRFLDGELTRSERQTLLRLLGSRPDLRQRLLDDEQMLDAASSLPRATPAADFVAKTMAALPEQANGSQVGPAEAGPYTVPVGAAFSSAVARGAEAGRRPAMAVARFALAASLLLAAGFWTGLRYQQTDVAVPADVATVESPSTVLVRLVLVHPDARSVAVAGDFNGWDAERSPLMRSESGIWTAMLPLNEGRYHYMFVVDGQQWVPDPLAEETSLDGFGARNSVLDVEI